MKTEWLATGRGYEIPCTFSIGRENTKVCVVAHGFGSSKESPTVQMLLKALPEQGIGVAAFDFPAHGESRVDGEYLRIPNCTADLADVEALARTLAPGAEITYFGSSFGAYTTLIYLSGLPGGGRRAFFRSAAVCMPALFRRPTKAQAEAMERDGFLILGEDYGCARPLKLTQAFLDDLDSHDVFRLWSREKAELRMIHGEADRTIPISEARRFAEQFGVPLSEVPGGDHRLSIPGAPERVLEEALSFFRAR